MKRITMVYPFAYEIKKINDKEIKRKTIPPRRKQNDITFSQKSRARMISAIYKRPKEFSHFMTITSPVNLLPHKREILKALRYKANKLNILYIWKLEFFKNGNIHFHVLLTATDRKIIELKKYLRKKILKLTNLDLTYTDRIVTAKRINKDPKIFDYVAKYITKEQNNCTKIGRYWGKNYKTLPLSAHTTTPEETEIAEYREYFLRKMYKHSIIFNHLIPESDYPLYPPQTEIAGDLVNIAILTNFSDDAPNATNAQKKCNITGDKNEQNT